MKRPEGGNAENLTAPWVADQSSIARSTTVEYLRHSRPSGEIGECEMAECGEAPTTGASITKSTSRKTESLQRRQKISERSDEKNSTRSIISVALRKTLLGWTERPRRSNSDSDLT